MDRLTEKGKHYPLPHEWARVSVIRKERIQICQLQNRLQQYEDLGLEPDKIKIALAKFKQFYDGTAEEILLDMKLIKNSIDLQKCKELLEQAAEEIENCYGKETELSERLRAFLKGED